MQKVVGSSPIIRFLEGLQGAANETDPSLALLELNAP
jgi:hypothetical protein